MSRPGMSKPDMSKPDMAMLIDFGSTYTKLRAVDLAAASVVATGQGPSTVTTDVTIGLEAALGDLSENMGGLPDFRHRLASSSAAGGLRMVTVGLVTELTAEAARQAALGAGARLVGSFAYRLTAGDIAAILELAPDVLLLSGGTDGGNSEAILHNAGKLAASLLGCPVIAAGNREAADEIHAMFDSAGKPLIVAGNVMPAFRELDIEPARKAIRKVFIERIVHAKGIDRAAEMFDAVLMPTPAAVMEGARLLSEGTASTPGLGPLAVIDIGGATTDVHSVASGNPAGNAVQYGLPEAYVKRTVEGDLGMRHNAAAIAEAAGDIDAKGLEAWLAKIARDTGALPATLEEQAAEQALAGAAIRIAMKRHAGSTTVVQTAAGPVVVQEGKDLTGIGALVGTGGALAHARDPAAILSAALADPDEPTSLRPVSPVLYIDDGYMLYAVGLLAEVEPEVALNLGLGGMRRLRTEDGNERRGAV